MAPVDSATGGATGVIQTIRADGGAESAVKASTNHPIWPWLATDKESETEPEDLYSRGDHADPSKVGWKLAVGDAAGGLQVLTHLRGNPTEDTGCCEERPIASAARQQHYGGLTAPPLLFTTTTAVRRLLLCVR